MSANIQPDLFNQNLVQEKDGELLVSSITVAENIDLLHDSLLSSISKYENELREFGDLKEQDFKESLNISNNKSLLKQRKAYLLNENQTMLLINLSRNTDLVIRFKVNLTKAFSIMKNKLFQKNLPTPLETARMLVQVLEEKEALLLTNKALEKQNTILMHTNNTYTATELAKELGLKSATILNQKLADMKVQYKVNNSWVFYSKYADLGYTSIKQHILENGKEIYDRKFTQTGRDFILKLFEIEGSAI
ncbi:Rha family transcriptional regulator [Aliarcobacter butzleri]|uniref:Antirepressor protein C-terminal domain-containing protein n=1 Tax=Aliarcobacter butzleri L348 TaxID=1447256 RepID=A0A0G9JRD2_9BACT|nr:Rha family transcriptional regulator [Aliarcobacter butzleri]KLD96720.1 hypothetical protein AA20_11530 [Aliarcobacter butzleri L348]